MKRDGHDLSARLSHSLETGGYRAIKATLDRFQRGESPLNGDRSAVCREIGEMESRIEEIRDQLGVRVALSPHMLRLKHELAPGA